MYDLSTISDLSWLEIMMTQADDNVRKRTIEYLNIYIYMLILSVCSSVFVREFVVLRSTCQFRHTVVVVVQLHE